MSQAVPPRPPAPLGERLRAFRYHPDEDVSGLSALPLQTQGEAPAVPADVELREYLSFELEGATYAVPLGAILEILRARPLVEIPRAEPPLLGVLDLRGTVTPVYDLALGLGLRASIRKVAGPAEECESIPRESRILVAHTPKGPAGTRGYEAFTKAFELGLMVRQSGDAIAMSPPLVIEKAQIDEIIDITAKTIKAVA